MIEIEEQPDRLACARHQVAIGWLYSQRHGRWLAWERIPGDDPDAITRHRCDFHGDPNPPWRQLELQDPETIHAGAQRVRQKLKIAPKEHIE